jgi:adenylate cyclase
VSGAEQLGSGLVGHMPIANTLAAWPAVLRSRNIRLWSGIVLALYLLDHFLNLALGLVSVGAMEWAAPLLSAPWRSPPGTALLLCALLAHFGLSLRSLHRRRTLAMSTREAAQLALGLLFPFLLVSHVVSTRIEPALTGTVASYGDVVRALWVTVPSSGVQQVMVLLVGWTHGCFGLWFWLRTKPWFPAWTWLLHAAALLVPILALLGFAEAGREIVAFADVTAPLTRAPRGGVAPDDIRAALYAAFALAIAGVLAARTLRWWRGRHQRIRVGYPDGRSISVPRGFSVLEASRVAQIPHVSLCGGSGRCSTCRIRVIEGFDLLPPPHAQERGTLARSRAAPDMRLACQLRPTHDLVVVPVFAVPKPRAAGLPVRRIGSASHERELAVLFCDLRGFTRRAEQWLPFDTVFLLNRYFEIVGEAVEAAGGYLDKFIGDGALALFGLGTPPEVACRQALAAAVSIARGLDAMNAQYATELNEPLRIAIGLHTGPAIVGDMGYGNAIGLTAVGDGINVASRLEGEAKERDVSAAISTAVMRRAGFDTRAYSTHSIQIRGRVAPVDAVLVPDLARLLDGAPVAAGDLQARAAG